MQVTKIVVTYESSGSGETTPSITLQPEGATYNQGATATALTITADGNPAPTYQWYSNTSNSNTNGTKISGATEASYTPSTATAGTFYYYCVATNSAGSATSDVATITVNTAQKNYTIIWSLGGNEYTAGNPTTSVASGSKITTLPTPPDGNAIGSCANTFMGWSSTDLGSAKGQPAPEDLFSTIEDSPIITQDTIFYAVFATDPTK
ncbi:MAG: immunoglobulin domain-containing protein [Paludibacteraceae bacterium]